MAKQMKAQSTGQGEKKAQPPAKAPEVKKGDAGRTAVAPRSTAAAPASPFGFMRRFAEEMDRLFEDFKHGASSLLPRLDHPFERGEAAEAAWRPTVEVAERGGQLVVRVDLPGLSKNDVKVEVRDDAVCIRGERRHEREEKRKGFYRSERSYGSFYREIPLPEGIDADQAKATFRHGVLEVTLPAPPKAAKGKQLQIEE